MIRSVRHPGSGVARPRCCSACCVALVFSMLVRCRARAARARTFCVCPAAALVAMVGRDVRAQRPVPSGGRAVAGAGDAAGRVVRGPLCRQPAPGTALASPTGERAPGDHRVDGRGRRNPRSRYRRAYQAHPALRARHRQAPAADRPPRPDADPGIHRPAVSLRAAARHRQGRRAGSHPAQARTADRRRAEDHAAARGVRSQDHLQHGRTDRRRQFSADRRRDRRHPSRKMGRNRLSRGIARSGHPALRPHHGGGRHLRRVDQPTLLQGSVPA